MYYGIKLYLSLKNKKPITPHQNFENLICEKYARSELSFSTGSLGALLLSIIPMQGIVAIDVITA
jgi:hypothetical protein